GIGAQDEPVLEGPGLALGAVAAEVLGRMGISTQRVPFDAGGEPRTAPAPQPGPLDHRDHVLGGTFERDLQRVAAALLDVLVQRRRPEGEQAAAPDVIGAETAGPDARRLAHVLPNRARSGSLRSIRRPAPLYVE